MTTPAEVEALLAAVLRCWNGRDAEGYGAAFIEDGSLVGFDGSAVESRRAIAGHLSAIFADHEPATYVWKVREVRELGDGVALLRAAVGMVPPGADDLKPDVNAQLSMVVRRVDGAWRVAHLQSTPAAFHGRPGDVEALTAELRDVLRGGVTGGC